MSWAKMRVRKDAEEAGFPVGPIRESPSLTRVSAREAWLQVGDRYVITAIPNRLYGAQVTPEGEVV
jgi:hypothetical protein